MYSKVELSCDSVRITNRTAIKCIEIKVTIIWLDS